MRIAETNHTFENPFFIATVVDNNDETFNYRVKVRLPIIHDKVEDENLPWAAKVDSSFMGFDNESTIKHSIPEVGTKVLVLAIANDPNSLVYLGNLYKKSNSTPTGDDYLNCYGIYDKDGNYIKLDKIQKLLELIWQGKINIDKVTEMNITVNGNVNLKANTVNITAPNNNIKGDVSIDGTLDVTKTVTAKVDVIGNGVSLHDHTHPFPYMAGPSPADGTTAVPTPSAA